MRDIIFNESQIVNFTVLLNTSKEAGNNCNNNISMNDYLVFPRIVYRTWFIDLCPADGFVIMDQQSYISGSCVSSDANWTMAKKRVVCISVLQYWYVCYIDRWWIGQHYMYVHHMWSTIGLLLDTLNCGLRMRRECRERAFAHNHLICMAKLWINITISRSRLKGYFESALLSKRNFILDMQHIMFVWLMCLVFP